ncbi:MAG: hypothetical protein M1825_006047 [Sarcosagium campestre]|nr:MAG: hypothetical protein M1825_006047 [Sarcosagium campestre]
MAAHRRKNLVASRRRVEDESEEEGGAADIINIDDDSASEASAITDPEDDDADAEGSDISEQDDPDSAPPAEKGVAVNGIGDTANGEAKSTAQSPDVPAQPTAGATLNDTDAMRNGINVLQDTAERREVDFDLMEETVSVSNDTERQESESQATRAELPHERKRRDQEEYRKKREADPTFVPNRGGFFMHDHRHSGPAANGFRPFGRGRGRGRGAFGNGFQSAKWVLSVIWDWRPRLTRFSSPHYQSSEPSESPWSHDLHEVVAPSKAHATQSSATAGGGSKSSAVQQSAPSHRSLSKSVHIGNVQIRVLLSGMKEPVTFPGVPVQQHTRLPHHRPPLRRDKPVRMSIPDSPPRYIFPTMERSFVFIPRALRPNQQGYGRGGSRSRYGPYRGISSRRTSAYGGSVYSPSVARSRRSSFAHESIRDGFMSPGGSNSSRPAGVTGESGGPVVRLPPGVDPQLHPHGVGAFAQSMIPEPGVPVVALPYRHAYPPPQNPTYRENRAGPIPMHQPRPQKAVSVADIESPEKVTYPPPQPQQHQPFYHQVPLQANGQPYVQEASAPPHSRNASYPSQPSTGTPLSHIPERAIHAQPFQPHPYMQPYYGPGYPVGPPQGGYYYAQPDPRGVGYRAPPNLAGPPVFVPGGPPGHNPYSVPSAAPAAPAGQSAGQGNTVAQESNGMVYYYDSTQLYNQPGGYVVPPPGGVVGMGGMMTPSPDGYYYPQAPAQAPMYFG